MTAQIAERLHYEGREVSMCSEPLADYFALAGIAPDFGADCTALWRGYVGTWEILGGRLYLTGLSGTSKSGAAANLATLFPGFPGRVFAHWYSGELRVPQGKILKYVHGGYRSTYESDLLITIGKGTVAKTHVRCNGRSTDPDEKRQGYGAGAMTVFARPKPGSEEDET